MIRKSRKRRAIFGTLLAIVSLAVILKLDQKNKKVTVTAGTLVSGDLPANNTQLQSNTTVGPSDTVSQPESSGEIFPNLPRSVLLDVPFTAQAPTGKWRDVRQGEGCEEASIVMAVHWALARKLTPQIAENEIIGLSDLAEKRFGHFQDESNADTLELLKEYFNYDNAYLRENISKDEMRFELSRGNVVIVPINALKLGNPFYQLPSPGNHKLVVIGYDDAAQKFITNDPGTSRGAGFRYDYNKMENALMDYPTGYHLSFETLRKSMLVVSRKPL